MACRCLSGRYVIDPSSHASYNASESGDGLSRRTSKPRLLKTDRSTWFSPITNAVARVYENCAGYNLRHCYFRGFVTNRDYLGSTLKDLSILCCFLVANFVVFMMIFTRISVHIAFLLLEAVRWIRRKTVQPELATAYMRVRSVSNIH